jgi:hypothetical protein
MQQRQIFIFKARSITALRYRPTQRCPHQRNSGFAPSNNFKIKYHEMPRTQTDVVDRQFDKPCAPRKAAPMATTLTSDRPAGIHYVPGLNYVTGM